MGQQYGQWRAIEIVNIMKRMTNEMHIYPESHKYKNKLASETIN